MKKYLISILTSISLLIPTSTLWGMNFPPAAPGFGGAGAPEAGSFDEFFLNTISNMSEQELEELAKLGEQIARDMAAQGINVDEFLKEQLGEFPAGIPGAQPAAQQPQKPSEPTIPTPEIKEEPAEETEVRPLVALAADKKEQIDYILMTIAEKIPELIRQANNNVQYQEELAPFVPDLITVNYFVRLLRQEKYFKYIGQETFAQLFEDLKRLSNVLESQEPLLFTDENQEAIDDAFARLHVSKSASMQEIEKAYKKMVRSTNPARIQSDLEESGASLEKIAAEVERAQKQFDKIETAYYTTQRIAKSHAAFNSIVKTVAATSSAIIKDTQKLLKLYDPEALKIKEEHEKRAAEAKALAIEAGKKEAPQAPYVFDRNAFNYGPPAQREAPAFQPSAPSYKPSSQEQQEGGGRFGGINKPSAPGAAKGPEGEAKKPATPQEKKAAEKEKKEKEELQKKKVEKKDQDLQVKIRLNGRREALERIASYLDETPPSQSDARYKLFADFEKYLTADDIKPPYSNPAAISALTKADEMDKTITYLAQSLQLFKNDVTRDMNSIPKNLKDMYKKELQKIFTKYQDDYFKKKLAKLLDIKVDRLKKEVSFGQKKLAIPNNEKKYIYFGFDDFAPSQTQPGKSVVYDKDHDALRALNFNPGTQGPVDPVADLTEVYKQIVDLMKDTKK